MGTTVLWAEQRQNTNLSQKGTLYRMKIHHKNSFQLRCLDQQLKTETEN
jgi:hypothetical protein